MRYLTKSRFALALECPTKLEYCDNADYANAMDSNEFMLALAEGGHQVGALAKCLFPSGVEIDAVGHDLQVEQTNAALVQDPVSLFEAAVRVGRLFIRADLLHRDGQRLDLYEVKAKGIDPDNLEILGAKGGFLAGMKPKLYDVAFQRHVLRRAFPDLEVRAHLVMPNKKATCAEAGLAQRLAIVKADGRVRIDTDASLRDGALARSILHVLPVDEYLDQLERLPLVLGGWEFGFEEGITELERRLGTEPFTPRLGAHCKGCEFHVTSKDSGRRDGRMECLQQAKGVPPEAARFGTVLDLYRGATDRLLATGKVLLVDLETEDLKLAEGADEITQSHRQWLQAEEARQALTTPLARKKAVRAKLAALPYPLHFVDFETSRPALPFHKGKGPYEQLLFQFSHHRIDETGQCRHQTQHLAESLGNLPSFDTVRALRNALCNDQGAVLHWWDHERTVLKELRTQLERTGENEIPDRNVLLAFLDELIGTEAAPGRLFDLGRLIHKTVFFPGTRGSSSLKKVLPALLAGSPGLRSRYAEPVYGTATFPSLNFLDQAWVRYDAEGRVIDPYELLGERVDDPDLAGLESLEDDEAAVCDGGAAMVAYGVLQNAQLSDEAAERLRKQLLRYCELDTLAMVMAWEGINELISA
jgi:hypothetical protein